MSQAIIPEVIKRELPNEVNSKQQTLNINLSQNIDRRINNYSTTNTTTQNITNYNRGGFFRFIFDIIIIPFKIIRFIWVACEKKFNIKETLRLERKRIAKSKWVNKYLRSSSKSYDFDEIF